MIIMMRSVDEDGVLFVTQRTKEGYIVRTIREVILIWVQY